MNGRRGSRNCAVWLVLLAMGFFPGASARAQDASSSLGQGTHLFRHLLNEQGLIPIQDPEQLASDPLHTVLIVLGESSVLDVLSTPLVDFLRLGGAVLVATDRDTADVQALTGLGIRVTGTQLQVPPGDPAVYRDKADCIFVEAVPGVVNLFKKRVSSRELTAVATNRPSFFENPNALLTVAALFPRSTQSAGEDQARLPVVLPFAGTWDGGGARGGRLLVLSDHSVFINAMLWQEDNSNFEFAESCIRWLANADSRSREPRTRALFYDEGHLIQSFQIPMKEIPPPPLDRIVQAVDAGLQELEEENALNRMIMDASRELLHPQALSALAVLLTLGMGVYGLARLGQMRYHQEPGVPGLASGLVQLMPAVGVLDQRQRVLLREGNLAEPARALARDCLDIAFPPRGTRLANAATSGRFPKIQIDGNWRERWRLGQVFSHVWQIAYGRKQRRVSLRRWRQLMHATQQLRQAAASGRIRLEDSDATGRP